jgi:Subtilisin-like serine proteases
MTKSLILLVFLLVQSVAFAQTQERILVKFRNSAIVRIVPVQQGLEAPSVLALSKRRDVEFAEMDQLVEPASIPNDPLYKFQWHLPSIHCPQAWDVTTGSTGVTIAIIDSGCAPGHPDLMANYVAGWNFYDRSTNTGDVTGHGTAVAGTCASIGNNGIGVAGVSWHSKIMPLRMTDRYGIGSWSGIVLAMQWAVDHGAKVINCSYAFLMASQSIKAMAQYATDHGCLFFIPSGNTGGLISYPADPNIIVVGGTDQYNRRVGFSSYGPSVTLCAPATAIYTTDLPAYGWYHQWQGTSMSSPLAAGVASLIWSKHPEWTNWQVRDALIHGVDDLGPIGWDQQFGFGKINAFKAVMN